MSVPGAVTMQADEPGQQVVYYEGDESVGPDDLVFGIIDQAGATVAAAPYVGELIYETVDLRLGRAIASFDAAQIGAYRIEVTGIDAGDCRRECLAAGPPRRLVPERDMIGRRLQERIFERLRLRIAIDVLDPGSIPRTEMGKAKRVYVRTSDGER